MEGPGCIHALVMQEEIQNVTEEARPTKSEYTEPMWVFDSRNYCSPLELNGLDILHVQLHAICHNRGVLKGQY